MTKVQLKHKIRELYDSSYPFHKIFWFNKDTLALHYGFWDVDTKTLHQALLNQNKAAADKLKIQKSDIVLDAGCGVGGTSIWLAKNYGIKVIGITLSKHQVEVARKYAKKHNVDHLVQFHVKDFTKTGFEDESFTKIFTIESVCHAERKEDFLVEAFRLLKPGGRIVMEEPFLQKDLLTDENKKIANELFEGWAIPNLLTASRFQKK